MELRDYQIDISNKACDILKEKKIVYLAMSVRTGKTITSFLTADKFGSNKVLFLTKKRAIKSIQDDFNLIKPAFQIVIINNESLHTIIENDFDLIISDEHHRNSAFPKPNKTAKLIKQRFGNLPMIFLSGTPAIESCSQWYHSFWVSNHSPFKEYSNFYKWAKNFVILKYKFFGAVRINDYSGGIDSAILPIVEPYLLKCSQEDAGFKTVIDENIIYFNQNEITKKISGCLLKDRIVEGVEEVILADNPAKLMSKIHQLSNGTCIFESGNSAIFDKSKAEFIRKHFEGKKIAIFYFFKKEYEILNDVFVNELTSDLEEFNATSKHIALQQVAGSEGISLKLADCIVYYSFGYSGKNYVQGRDRMSTKDRDKNNVFFVFEKDSINEKIYKTIINKKTYSDKLFCKDYGIRIKAPNKD